MDVDEYLALTIKGMKECASLMKEKGLDVTKIKSIMGDGIICGICGVDKDGNAITPYINYLDSRTKDDVDLVNSWDLDIFGKETGNPEANCLSRLHISTSDHGLHSISCTSTNRNSCRKSCFLCNFFC